MYLIWQSIFPRKVQKKYPKFQNCTISISKLWLTCDCLFFSLTLPFSVSVLYMSHEFSLSPVCLFGLSHLSPVCGNSVSVFFLTSFCVFACLSVSTFCLGLCLSHHNTASELESTQNLSFALLCNLYYINFVFNICIYKSKDYDFDIISEQVCPCDKRKQLRPYLW